MATWRARPKLSEKIERIVKDRAAKDGTQLKLFVQSMVEIGVGILRNNGTSHVFIVPHLTEKFGSLKECEFVIDGTYEQKLTVVRHLANGHGKLGKVLAEAIVLGLIEKKVIAV